MADGMLNGSDERVGGGWGDHRGHWHCAADRGTQIRSSGSRLIAMNIILYLSVVSDGC